MFAPPIAVSKKSQTQPPIANVVDRAQAGTPTRQAPAWAASEEVFAERALRHSESEVKQRRNKKGRVASAKESTHPPRDLGRIPVFSDNNERRLDKVLLPAAALGAGRVQAKLKVGSIDDSLEREAEGVADRVMRTAVDSTSEMIAPPPRISRTDGFDGGRHSQKETVDRTAGEGYLPSAIEEVLRSPGRPLDRDTRVFMEHRLGHDFSAVKVHTDGVAASSARRIGARAFAFGNDLGFGLGEYAPATGEGRRLIAHELVHVVQQTAVRNQGTRRSSPTNAIVQRSPETTEQGLLGQKQITITSDPDPKSVKESRKRGTPTKTVYEIKKASSNVSDQAEVRIAEKFAADGHQVHFKATSGNHRSGDLMIDGVETDVKHLTKDSSIPSAIERSLGQGKRVILDGTTIKLSLAEAAAGIREHERGVAEHPGKFRRLEAVSILLGDGTVYVYNRSGSPLKVERIGAGGAGTSAGGGSGAGPKLPVDANRAPGRGLQTDQTGDSSAANTSSNTETSATVGDPLRAPEVLGAEGEAAKGGAEGLGVTLLSGQVEGLQESEREKFTSWLSANEVKFRTFWSRGEDPIVTLIVQKPNAADLTQFPDVSQVTHFQHAYISGYQPSAGSRKRRSSARSSGRESHESSVASCRPTSATSDFDVERPEKHMTLDQEVRYQNLSFQKGDPFAAEGPPIPGWHYVSHVEAIPNPGLLGEEGHPEHSLGWALPGALSKVCGVHAKAGDLLDSSARIDVSRLRGN